MLSKSVTDIPYISKLPLSGSVEWVAIPVFVSVKSKNFQEASSESKTVMLDAFTAVEKIDSNSFHISLLEFESEFEELRASIELIRVNDSESMVKVSNYIIIKFPEKGRFWDKIEYLSNVLDALDQYTLGFKSDKAVTVRFGERYGLAK